MPKFIDLFTYSDGQLFWKETNQFAGWISNNGYYTVDIECKKYLVHRVIYEMFWGHCPELIDHINQNKLDNRIENLRPSNKRDNAFNSKIRVDNTSGARGVSFSKSNQKWFAYIWLHGKRISGGYHEDIEDAISARANLERLYK